MIRVTKHGILVDRVFLQTLLNLFFEDPVEPNAVICVDASSADHPRIYSTLPHLPA